MLSIKKISFLASAVDADADQLLIAPGYPTGEIILGYNYDTFAFYMKNLNASYALDQFELHIKGHEDGAFVKVAGSAWNTADGVVKFCSTVPNTLAASATTYIVVDLHRCYSIKFVGSSNSTDGAQPYIYGTFYGEATDMMVRE